MPNRSENYNCLETLLLATATAADATPVKTAGVDCTDFDSLHFNLSIGATLGTGAGAMTYKVQESDTDVDGNYTDAAAVDVVDHGEALVANKTKRIAYVGNKKFSRLYIVPKANDIYTVSAHRGYAATKPTANPA